CYWQNNKVLEIINRPVEGALSLKSNTPSNDPDKQNAAFQRQVAKAMAVNAAAFAALRKEIEDPAVRRALAAAQRQSLQAVKALPTAQSRRPVTFAITEPFLT